MPPPARWLALLPASKGVTSRASSPTWGELANGAAAAVLAALGERDQGDDPTPLSARETTPAWRRYDGVLHRAADPGSLDGAERRRWHRHVRYVSALAGMIAPTDRLPAYRLEMAAVIEPLGGLSGHWRPHVAALLDEQLAVGGRLWLLTGGEYARAVELPERRRLVEPSFLRPDGVRAMPSATVKQARGQLARALVQHPELARRPIDDGWASIELTCAGKPVRFEGANDDGMPVWRSAA